MKVKRKKNKKFKKLQNKWKRGKKLIEGKKEKDIQGKKRKECRKV